MIPTGTTPSTIHDGVRKLCATIAQGEPLYVKVKPEPWALKNECFPNVRRKVEKSGGEIVYGWMIWQHGKYFIEAEHHAVYRRPVGSLVDVTPGSSKRILFMPDSSAVYEVGTTQRVDNVRMALIDDPRLERMLALFSERTALINEVGVSGGKVVLTGTSVVQLRGIENELRVLAEEVVVPRRQFVALR